MPNNPKDSLIYKLVEIGHRIAHERTASWVAVTSDRQQEHEAWTKAGGHDSLNPIRVPPFTVAEAHELQARLIFEHSHSQELQPTAAQLDAIKDEYASTLNFIIGSVGTRARWQVRLLQGVPVPDKELSTRGVAINPNYYPFLASELHDAALRVDPLVWREFCSFVSKRKGSLKPLLSLPHDFELLPSPRAKPGAQDAAQSVLSMDAALRDLLKAAGCAEAAAVSVCTSQGAPAGLAFEALSNKYFRGHEADLRQLCASHVLFYNHGADTVEFESDLMRRIAASWLDEPLHKCCLGLVRTLLELQAAVTAKAEAERQKCR